MRPLTDNETRALFEKLAKYIGDHIKDMLTTSKPAYCFRLHKDRVYYVAEPLMKQAISIARPNLASLGTCLGKFSNSGVFKLHITALDYLAMYAKHKVWIKQNGEMPFLYGNHVLKAHIHKITDDTPENQGVVVLSQSSTPLVSGFFHQGQFERYIDRRFGLSGLRSAR